MSNEHGNNNDVVNSSNQLQLESNNVRQDLVDSAVKFLRNPQVNTSSMDKKKLFLLNKGLTHEEIDLAFSRSNLSYGLDESLQSKTFWHQNSTIGSFIIFSGIIYGIYKIYKVFFSRNNEKEKRLDVIEETIAELRKSVDETLIKFQNTMSAMQTTLEKQESYLKLIAKNTDITSESSNTDSIKSEVASIKRILLSRDKFAPVPKTSPVLPDWQLNDENTTTEEAKLIETDDKSKEDIETIKNTNENLHET